jgi:hypothetical protein
MPPLDLTSILRQYHAPESVHLLIEVANLAWPPSIWTKDKVHLKHTGELDGDRSLLMKVSSSLFPDYVLIT